MEFKSLEKDSVRRNLSMTEEQLNMAIKRMIRRHPLENWINSYIANNGQKVCYIKLEFYEWLKEVYFSDEYYLDADIKFFQKQIYRLEEELKISHKVLEYAEMTIRELCDYFDKSISSIYMALGRMRKKGKIQTQYLEDGRVVVPSEGVKWLAENYFRIEHLKYLELYKLELQKRKKEIYEKSRTKI